jgi:RNA polymerase sigma-70 factor (ECF subfamily)
VFILAHIEELPQRDIAEIMNLSVKAVESLLQRGKMNLRNKLGKMYEGKLKNERLK